MKLTNLLRELSAKYPQRYSSINKEYQAKTTKVSPVTNYKFLKSLQEMPTIDEQVFNIDNIKIIGITGSTGKSTVAYLTHKYLKSIGKKSILYSSIEIDSKASNKLPENASERALTKEADILDIIEEASSYQAEYLVLEINETTISEGIIKDIPFKIRALTNIDKYNSEEFVDVDAYAETKKSFFRNIPAADNCISVFGMTNHFTREEFNQLLSLSSNEVVTYGSKYVCERFNADYNNIDYLLKPTQNVGLDSINGLNFNIKIKGGAEMSIQTKLLSSHNALNITLCVAILDALKEFDHTAFSAFIKDINIPGRNELIKFNNCYFVIGMGLFPALEDFKRYKELGDINTIKVLIGSTGIGFKSWDAKFQSSRREQILSIHRKYAMDYLANYADYAYLTSNDPAASDPLLIANQLAGYLNNRIPFTINVDRKQAIKNAIMEAKDGDLIFLAGRGNRQYFCKSATEYELFTDKEIVLATLKEMENKLWKNTLK